MRKLTHPAVMLAVLSPVIGELVSGSTPPLAFFNPLTLPFMIFFYGAGVLLIREIALRFELRWPGLLLLTAVFGVIAEAGIAGTWTNTGPDAGADLLLGTWLGLNWGIVLPFCLYHAVFSLGIPLALTNLRFPDRRAERWLSRRTAILLAVPWLVFSGAFLVVRADPIHTPVTLAIGAAFAWLAFRSRRWTDLAEIRIRADLAARRIMLVTFATTFGIFAIGWWTRPDIPFLMPIITLTIATTLAIWWRAIISRDGTAVTDDTALVPVICGALLYLSVQGGVVEVLGGLGMSFVALTTWACLWRLWRRHVPRRARSQRRRVALDVA